MKKYTFNFLTALVITTLLGCGNSQQNSQKDNNTDSSSNQTLIKKLI